MTADAVKGFVDLAGAMTGVGVDRAKDAVRTLLTVALEVLDNPAAAMSHLGDTAKQNAAHVGRSVDDAADDVSELIRSEVDRVAARFGFVREEELAALRARVQRLEAQVAASGAATAPAAPSADKPRAKTTSKSKPQSTSASASRTSGASAKAKKGGRSRV